MLEPPGIAVADLIERVRTSFAIPVHGATFLPAGNDDAAWAFRLSAGEDAWFLKVVARPVDTASLELPRYLAEHGVGHLVASIPTTAGDSFDQGDPYSFIVYPFVDGEPGGDIGLTSAQQTELGRAVRRIHDLPVPAGLARSVRREQFVPPDVQGARRVGSEVRSASFEDRAQRSLSAFWLRNGRETSVVSPKEGSVRGWNFTDWGEDVAVDVPLGRARPDDFDALLLPGGVINPDTLRMQPQAVAFVKAFFDAGKPVAAICHGPWTIIEAGAARGRRVASWPSLKTDLRNAGAEWVDQEAVVDRNLVTSRKPDDIPAFNREMIALFGRA